VENLTVGKSMRDIFLISVVLSAIQDYFARSECNEINRVFIFSSLASMRLNYENQEKFIIDLKNTVPKKSIYIPAFTYNSRRMTPYHVNEAPSPQNGSLSRVVFKENLHNGNRTLDEDYSYFVLQGQNRSESQKTRESEWKSKSFGMDSHHENLYLEPAIFLCIGNGLKDGFTPAMHFEAMHNVEYRDYLKIPSQLVTGNFKSYYARKEGHYSEFGKNGREKLVQEFLASPKSSFQAYSIQGAAKMYAFTLSDLSEVTNKALSLNKNFFLT
jgi:aminoglycoside N3'-acetyltransferase